MNDFTVTILHVEDDPLLAEIVRKAFLRFGFRGEMITATSLNEAVRLLGEQAKNSRPVSLIITDMQLPDGTGLDLIREVKSEPAWRMIPVIVLSHDAGEGIIRDAYALGASSYIPKSNVWNAGHGSLQSIYRYWLESVILPRAGARDRLQEALERAIALRTRVADVYLRLARAFPEANEEATFWLNRALGEGNLSNLLAFFRNKVLETDVPPGTIDRFSGMQARVRDALKAAEERLSAVPAPSPALGYELAIELTDALDEGVFAEVLGILFPAGAVATAALRARAALQIQELASYIRARTEDEDLRRKADSLLDWSDRIRSISERKI